MSVLSQLQADVFGVLSELPDLADVAGLLERPRRTEEERALYVGQWEQAMQGMLAKNGKLGLSFLVLMPTLPAPSNTEPGPRFDPQVTIRFVEVLELNLSPAGTQIACEDAVMTAAAALQNWPRGGGRSIVISKEGAQPVILEGMEESAVVYDLTVQSIMNVVQPARAACPTVTLAGDQLTLASETDAQIYVTTDGTFPGPSNPTASLYSAAFAVESGMTVRAAAYLSGKNPSPIAFAKVV
jgi:hypothetical protein